MPDSSRARSWRLTFESPIPSRAWRCRQRTGRTQHRARRTARDAACCPPSDCSRDARILALSLNRQPSPPPAPATGRFRSVAGPRSHTTGPLNLSRSASYVNHSWLAPIARVPPLPPSRASSCRRCWGLSHSLRAKTTRRFQNAYNRTKCAKCSSWLPNGTDLTKVGVIFSQNRA